MNSRTLLSANVSRDTGSIRIARRAGTADAAEATAISRLLTARIVNGSLGDTPKRYPART
jgi:hypothetical protein